MARVSIVVEDGAVYKDGYSYSGLDFSNCGIPANVWALQWYNTYGDIELLDDTGYQVGGHEDITELPAWANACLVKWQEAEDARIAAEEAEAAAEQAQSE